MRGIPMEGRRSSCVKSEYGFYERDERTPSRDQDRQYTDSHNAGLATVDLRLLALDDLGPARPCSAPPRSTSFLFVLVLYDRHVASSRIGEWSRPTDDARPKTTKPENRDVQHHGGSKVQGWGAPVASWLHFTYTPDATKG
jgi:hypothetical protein